MKTTAEQFKAYQEFCKEWQRKLGLTQYDPSFEWKPNDENKAWITASVSDGMVEFGLAKDWDDAILNKKELEKVAMHEAAELMLYRMAKLLEPYYSENLIKEIRHDIIRRLENLFFP